MNWHAGSRPKGAAAMTSESAGIRIGSYAAAGIELESVDCPLGCRAGDEPVVEGFDRLTGGPGRYQVVRCRGCQLMRTSPRPPATAIGLFYPDDYSPYVTTRPSQSTIGKPRSRWRRAIRRIMTPRNRELPPAEPGHLLEVGCGSGGFLHEMASAGWSVEGIEFSEAAATAGRAFGYPVHVGALEEAPPPARAPSLIVGWMVLEHVHEPVAALRKLRTWVRPDGRLVLSVPDAGAWERRMFGNAWYALDVPRHLFHYTPASMRAVLAAGGWQLERIIWHDNPNNAVQSLRHVCEDRGWTRAARYLRDIAEERRLRYPRFLLGKILGTMRQSGRMTVWARPTR
jgi:SAM-dependent methyltransferase